MMIILMTDSNMSPGINALNFMNFNIQGNNNIWYDYFPYSRYEFVVVVNMGITLYKGNKLIQENVILPNYVLGKMHCFGITELSNAI